LQKQLIKKVDDAGSPLGWLSAAEVFVANGGKLYVRNLPGKGCVFTVELPNPAIAKSPTSNP
jgi:signal transduction histidine kinase